VGLNLSFLGGAGTVTGSKYLVEHEKHKLLVDCGLFQGFKALRLKNWAPFPVAPGSIDAVVLTHAHLDHCGYLPLLIKRGFRGPVYCSRATRDLCAILLPDAGHLQEKDAEFANRHGFSKHKPALPLYTLEDARAALEHLTPIPFDQGADVAGRRRGAAAPERPYSRRWIGSARVGRHHDRLLR
jgi:metallo-beta-lactamase family protein